MTQKIAVVLFNLGGPDTPEAIRPFLKNLFSDKRIITAPAPIRWLLARLISTTRAPKVKPLYAEMGGASPILPNTLAQAKALEEALNTSHQPLATSHYQTFIAMRYWHPFTAEAVQQVKAYAPDKIVLLPLYPQFSTTTSESSFVEWEAEAKKAGLNVPTHRIGCYPQARKFLEAEAALLLPMIEAAQRAHPDKTPLVLFSAHGLPQKIIDQKGDPYVWQIEQTAKGIVEVISRQSSAFDYRISYQSRVGPVEWVKPYTDAEIRKAGAEGRPLILVPIAFVSEHIETLVELDIENKHLAEESGCAGYWRVPTVSVHPLFIEALAEAVESALHSPKKALCPPQYTACGCR